MKKSLFDNCPFPNNYISCKLKMITQKAFSCIRFSPCRNLISFYVAKQRFNQIICVDFTLDRIKLIVMEEKHSKTIIKTTEANRVIPFNFKLRFARFNGAYHIGYAL